MTIRKLCYIAACATSLILLGLDALAVEFLYPGIQPKLSAGAGQTVSRGPSALFYNPANLIFSKHIEPYADIAFANVSYSYQHSDTEQFEPAQVTVNAPPVTMGLGYRPISSLALGVVLMPTGTGNIQVIPHVPVQVTSSAYQSMDIAQKVTSYKLALGAAYRFNHPVTVGFGMIRNSEQTALQVTPVDADSPLIEADYEGTGNQFIAGLRSEVLDRALVLALSFRTAAVKAYKGKIRLNLDQVGEYAPIEGSAYLPAAIGFGAETRLGDFGFFFEYVREQWSAGRLNQKRGFPSDPSSVDAVDTNNIALGAKYWFAKRHMLEAAFGMYGANVGTGTETETGDGSSTSTSEHVGGLQFGNLEGIARTVVAGGYRYKVSGESYLATGLMYQTGNRVIPDGFDGQGTYSLRIIMATVGGTYGF